MGVDPKIWENPQIIHFHKVFPYKPSILGYHYFRKHPYGGTSLKPHDTESQVPCLTRTAQVLTRAGAEVTLASVEKTLELRLSHGMTVRRLEMFDETLGEMRSKHSDLPCLTFFSANPRDFYF